MMRILENVLAVIGLIATIGLALYGVLGLEPQSSPCAATIRQCGYGMTCGRIECYKPEGRT